MEQVNSSDRALRVIVSGGGTGGHIFPAVAIANAIKESYPKAEILFVGAKGKMEMEKVPKAGYPIQGLWISGIQRKLSLQNLLFPIKLLVSLFQAYKIAKRFKPDLAVGVGGFAAGPLLKVATMMKVPSLIHESNSYPGITNKLLGKSVQKVCVAFDGMEKFFPKEKLVITGNPVRREILDSNDQRAEGYAFFNLDPAKKTLLIIGGSQGARSINHAIAGSLKEIADTGIQVLWQTGKSFVSSAKTKIEDLDTSSIQAHDFIYDMSKAYAVADLVVSRSGAMSVSEIALVGKPSILVPFPYAAEDHQTKNARALVNNEAAILVPDGKVSSDIAEAISSTISDERKLAEMGAKAQELGITNATELVMEQVNVLVGA